MATYVYLTFVSETSLPRTKFTLCIYRITRTSCAYGWLRNLALFPLRKPYNMSSRHPETYHLPYIYSTVIPGSSNGDRTSHFLANY